MELFAKINQMTTDLTRGTFLGELMNQYSLLFTVLALLLAALICFSGYRWFRFWCSVLGFILFYYVGTTVCGLLTANNMIQTIVGVICGIGGAVLAFSLLKAGVFILCAAIGFFIVFTLTGSNLLISLLIGLGLGVLSCWIGDYLIISLTAFSGGTLLASGISDLTKMNASLGWLLSIALIIAGVIVQLTDRNKHRKRR